MLLHDVRRNKEQELWAGVSPHPLGPWVSCFVEKGMSGREPVGSELEGGVLLLSSLEAVLMR